jgi:hypothetical protein
MQDTGEGEWGRGLGRAMCCERWKKHRKKKEKRIGKENVRRLVELLLFLLLFL